MPGDRELIQIVDAALAEANRRAGEWIVCRPGCFECCMGAFPITQADADRLRAGLKALASVDPERAGRIVMRARRWQGNDDEACPVLDPGTGTCDLYEARPVTCRTFGPAIRWGEGDVGACELNFVGAGEEEIAACAVSIAAAGFEEELFADLPEGRASVAVVVAGGEDGDAASR
jgi:Fe-S-cluster containining protein